MKKLSQRAAVLTPSITVGLVLFAVGLTGLLAYRAFDASRAQQQLTERTLREYAGFAAFQLKNATIGRITGQQRGAFDLVARWINTLGPTPPLGAERAAALIQEKGQICRCLDGVSFYYQVTFADSGIEASASGLATAANLEWIRDTVMAQTGGPAGPNQCSPTWPARDRSAFQSRRNTSRRSFRTCESNRTSHKIVYKSNAAVAPQYSATDSLEDRLRGLHFEVAINPAAAGRLIIGGLPRSRLPEVLATTFVSVILLVLLLYQFRRQEELGRLRDDFVSGVSHELRTPLAQIRLLAELLRMGKVPTEEQKERSLRIIDKEARRLSFLVDSILSFTGSGRGKMSPVRTNVAIAIEEIVSGFEPLAEAEGVRITTRLDRAIVADVDRGALRQVLLNLLDNAVRYGPPGQVVTIATTAAGQIWMLKVADEGPGIPADECERIFAPYYRMKRDAGGAVGGTGIGPSVVRRLVTEHQGKVYVVSASSEAANGGGPNRDAPNTDGANEDGPNHHEANGNGALGNDASGRRAAGARFVVSLPIDSAPNDS